MEKSTKTKRKVPEVRQTKTSLARTKLAQTKMLPKPGPLKKFESTTKSTRKKNVPIQGRPDETYIHEPQEKQVKPKVRRSLSAQHFDRKRIAINNIEKTVTKSEMTQSMESLKELTVIIEASLSQTYILETSKNRRSTCFKSEMIEFRSTPAPLKTILQEHLNGWLTMRGKPRRTYFHLKSFAVDNDTFEDSNRNKVLETHKIDSIVKDALEDLNLLIQQMYSPENCEAWLGMIRLKYSNIEDLHQYWQCKAGIERVTGNISSAVECYKTAFVKGAELQTMEEFLDQLLQGFSILNVPYDLKEGESNERQIKAVREIFKSNIIQIARQEKVIQEKNKIEEKIGNNFREDTPILRKSRLSLYDK